MALGATIYKAEVQLSDMDRGFYSGFNLTLARHPSETQERMMVRLLAFLMHASKDLLFTRGLCADDQPDLWRKSLSGEIEVWIDVGLPSEKRIRQACARAHRVFLYAYGGRVAHLWWQKFEESARRFKNLGVFELPAEGTGVLKTLVRRKMQLQCSIQDACIWLGDDDNTIEIAPVRRLSPD